MDKTSRNYLEKLINGFGPSGFEREVVKIVKDYVKGFSDNISQDKLGSLLFEKKGSSEKPVIILPGHVDEIGFVISGIHEKGFLYFNTIGGWFDQVLLGQRVLIRTVKGDIHGIIAAKPPHLLSPEERTKVVEKSKMFIDIGCSNKREATEMGVRIGDPVMPFSRFSTTKKKVFEVKNGKETEKGSMELAIGKAFDDRIGAFMASETIRRLKEQNISHPNTIIGIATVQEEVGLRGARTAGWIAEPDICITLETDIAGDVPGIEPYQAPAVMGKGPSVLTFDASMIPNQILKELVISTAEKNNIPYQLSQVAQGGTDAGAVHILRAGCPSIVLGVPTRHIHSHAGILSLEDVENCIKLLVELIKIIDTKTADSFIML